MDQSTQTYIYTTTGHQRPVLLPTTGDVRFVLSLLEGDAGYLETTCDPAHTVGQNTALWERFDGGLTGGLNQVTALRAVLNRNSGWARLAVQVGIEKI